MAEVLDAVVKRDGGRLGLRVAYRASGEGPRDIVVVANRYTCCEVYRGCRLFRGGDRQVTALANRSVLRGGLRAPC